MLFRSRAIRLIANKMAEAIIEGRHEYDAKMGELYGEQGYTTDMSPFRPLPEDLVPEVEEELEVEEGVEFEETDEEFVIVDDTLEFVEGEVEPEIIPEKERYYDVAKDYGAIGEED